MKFVPLSLAFIALLAFTTLTTAQDQSGEQAVRRVVADFAGAINRGDVKAFADYFRVARHPPTTGNR